ncbi:MAG: UDP-2,3-diacylglucosamine diphosphatase [Candidatus Zixiibacteriota bacterium]
MHRICSSGSIPPAYIVVMALYLFSDAHLGADPPDKEAVKLENIGRLFQKVRHDGDRLVILGDLFDFWFEYKYAIPKEYHRMLVLLTDLIDQGIRIDYVTGNHDFWMGDFFPSHLGVPLHRDTYDLEYDGKKLHLVHGDGLAKADRGYRLLKRIFRNPVNVWLYRKLPPDWAIPLARTVSGSSRQHTSGREQTFAADYEEYARKKLTSGYDIVAIAHLHTPVIKPLGSGIYVNTGDFIKHFSYGRLANGQISLLKLK